MEVTDKTISGLGTLLCEKQEASVVKAVADRLGLSVADAYEAYFSSKISGLIESGDLGAQYLSPEYLAEEVVREAG